MKVLCPHCEKVQDVSKHERDELVEVKGEEFSVKSKVFVCKKCKQEWDDPEAEFGALELAYREYWTRHKLALPEDIVALRERFGLSQLEFAVLMGWGIATLSRYENGALRSDAHETALEMVRANPINLLELVSNERKLLKDERRAELKRKVESVAADSKWINLGIPLQGEVGNENFNIVKFRNVVLYFCKTQHGVWKTKLNKLLFYADFLHFKKYNKPLTGSAYLALPYGPVPLGYDQIFGTLALVGDVSIEEEEAGEAVGEKVRARKAPILSEFSSHELEVLEMVKDKFKQSSAKVISQLSHEELGWKETETGKAIDYNYAKKLKVEF